MRGRGIMLRDGRLVSGCSQQRMLDCMDIGEEVRSGSIRLSGYGSTTVTGVETTDEREWE